MFPKSNGNGEYTVNKKTGIALSIVIIIMAGLFTIMGAAYAKGSQLDVLDSQVSDLRADVKDFVPRTEIESRLDSIDNALERIEGKLN